MRLAKGALGFGLELVELTVWPLVVRREPRPLRLEVVLGYLPRLRASWGLGSPASPG